MYRFGATYMENKGRKRSAFFTIFFLCCFIIIIPRSLVYVSISRQNLVILTVNKDLIENLESKLLQEQEFQEENDILADILNRSMNTITEWNESSQLFFRGITLGKVNVSDLDEFILEQSQKNDSHGVFITKRYSEFFNYSSSIIDEAVKWALDFTSMFNKFSLPRTHTDNLFLVWHQYILHGYRYARELNYATTKWNATSAFFGLRNCRITNGRAFYECNPDTNKTVSLFGTRWMNTANLANCFLILYNETGLCEALDRAFLEWDDLNTYYWNESRNAYEYSRTWRTLEWSTLEVCFNFEKLRQLNGTLKNWNRIYFDLQSRYVVNAWSSPQWNAKVVAHSEGVSQKRLHGTLDAWMLLQTYFGNFNQTNQNNTRNMLEGNTVTQAWKALLDSSAELYNPTSYRFKLDSDKSESDYATAEGCMTLFLMGFSPQNGSGIMLPNRCFAYSGEPFPADFLNFLYSERQIKIPVYANTTLKFMFGSIHPNYTFPENGLYNITFTSDWNSIDQVDLLKRIDIEMPVQQPCTPPLSPTSTSPTSTSSSLPLLNSSNNPSTLNDTNHNSNNNSNTTFFAMIGFQIAIIILVLRRIRKKSRID
jgi:hypothetical protein